MTLGDTQLQVLGNLLRAGDGTVGDVAGNPHDLRAIGDATRRLARRGLVTVAQTRGRAKVYRITAAGRAELERAETAGR